MPARITGPIHLPFKVGAAIQTISVIGKAQQKQWVTRKYIAHRANLAFETLRHITTPLANAGILKCKMGMYGGYKVVRKTSLQELFEIFPDCTETTANSAEMVRRIKKIERRLRTILI